MKIMMKYGINMLEFTLLILAGFILGYQLGLTQRENGNNKHRIR